MRTQSNPELLLDPYSARSWGVVGGVVLFFSVYLTWTAYSEGLIGSSPAKASAVPEPAVKDDVQKVRAHSIQHLLHPAQLTRDFFAPPRSYRTAVRS